MQDLATEFHSHHSFTHVTGETRGHSMELQISFPPYSQQILVNEISQHTDMQITTKDHF